MLHEHPRMAMVVVREVERFTFRPGLAPRARYYAVVFLNQLQLSHNPAFGGHPRSGMWSLVCGIVYRDVKLHSYGRPKVLVSPALFVKVS